MPLEELACFGATGKLKKAAVGVDNYFLVVGKSTSWTTCVSVSIILDLARLTRVFGSLASGIPGWSSLKPHSMHSRFC